MTEDKTGKIIANFIMNDLKGMLNKKKLSIEECPISAEAIGYLARRVNDGSLDKKQMRKIAQGWIDEA